MYVSGRQPWKQFLTIENQSVIKKVAGLDGYNILCQTADLWFVTIHRI
jgi:hypothetical protein